MLKKPSKIKMFGMWSWGMIHLAVCWSWFLLSFQEPCKSDVKLLKISHGRVFTP